jgi:hypothetical protein
MGDLPTLICVMFALTLSSGLGEVYAQPQTPRSVPARPSSTSPEPPITDFLKPLSRDLERQLPDLGTSRELQNQPEQEDPGLSTWWVWPKTTPTEGSTQGGAPRSGG